MATRQAMGATARFISTAKQIIAAKRDDNAMRCVTCLHAVGNPNLGFADSMHIMCNRFGKNIILYKLYTHGPDAPQKFLVRVGSEQGKMSFSPYPLAHTVLKDNKCDHHSDCGAINLIIRPFGRGRSGRSRQP
jgi:hypothetical protein